MHQSVADVDQLFALEELIKNTVEILIVLYRDIARIGLFELITVVYLCKIVAHDSVDNHDSRYDGFNSMVNSLNRYLFERISKQ